MTTIVDVLDRHLRHGARYEQVVLMYDDGEPTIVSENLLSGRADGLLSPRSGYVEYQGRRVAISRGDTLAIQFDEDGTQKLVVNGVMAS